MAFQNRNPPSFSFSEWIDPTSAAEEKACAWRDTSKVNGMGLSVDRAVRFQGQHHIAVVNRQAVRNLNSAHDAVDRVIPFLWIQIQRMKIICLGCPFCRRSGRGASALLNRIEKQRRSNCAFALLPGI